MDSRMTLQVAQEHIADLRRSADSARSATRVVVDERVHTEVIALRMAGPDEVNVVALLATLDSGRPLAGDTLVAVVDGKLVAAISLSDGRVVADPFLPTKDARLLLEMRAAQLAPVSRRRPRRRRWRLRPRFA
jgi:hypothetical protein